MRIHSMNCRSLLWKFRYKMALRSVKAAKGAGKSSEEIHEMFNQIMNYDIDNLPNDEAHKKYRAAVEHAKKALENGKSSEEAHKIFQQVLDSKGEGHGHKHA